MAGVQYLALLRGINVGGKNLVKMAELRDHFTDMGFDDVATYIQSGNVLFRAPRQPRARLAARIESELGPLAAGGLKVVLLTWAQFGRVVGGAPRGFGAETHRSDVIFLRKPLTVKRALGVLELKDGVDRVWPGTGIVYFSRLESKASSSRLSKVVALPEYQDMTIRSWSTTTKLLALMSSRAGG